ESPRFVPGREAVHHPVTHAFHHGRSVWLPEVTDEWLERVAIDREHLALMRSLEPKSFITVPLIIETDTLGALTFCFSESNRRHDQEDLELAEEVARRVALAVQNAKLYLALTEADMRKDEFLAMLAHELRNPLAPIRNALQVFKLEGSAALATKAREIMERQM